MSYGDIGYFEDPADEDIEDRNDDSAKEEMELDDDQ